MRENKPCNDAIFYGFDKSESCDSTSVMYDNIHIENASLEDYEYMRILVGAILGK